MPGLFEGLQGGQSELGKECGCRCGQNSGLEWDEGSDVGLKALGRSEHE